MSRFKFLTDITEPMFGSFTKEYPDQFTTKRKNNVIHLFKVVGINDDGISIKSLLDKHVDVIPFNEITKIKNYATAEILKADRYEPLDNDSIVKLFMNKTEDTVTLFYSQTPDGDLQEGAFEEMAIKKTGLTLKLIDGTEISSVAIYSKADVISLG
jgi:hypothetical protein